MGALLAGLIMFPQLRAILVWNGIWRLLAAMPLAILACYIAMLPVLGAIDPTFYVPAPLIMRAISAFGTVFVCLLWLARVAIRYTA